MSLRILKGEQNQRCDRLMLVSNRRASSKTKPNPKKEGCIFFLSFVYVSKFCVFLLTKTKSFSNWWLCVWVRVFWMNFLFLGSFLSRVWFFFRWIFFWFCFLFFYIIILFNVTLVNWLSAWGNWREKNYWVCSFLFVQVVPWIDSLKDVSVLVF